MSENNDDPKTPDALNDLQKTVLECVESMLKKEKRPGRILTMLHLRFELGRSRQKIGDHLGLGCERIRQIERGFIGKIAKELNTTEKSIRDTLFGLPLRIEIEETKPAAPKIALLEVISVPDLFKIICEHVLLIPAGLRIVKEPVRTLEVRASLSLENAELALQGMKNLGLIDGRTPWTVIQIIEEVAIPKFNGYNKNHK